jgi:hypothetical protein
MADRITDLEELQVERFALEIREGELERFEEDPDRFLQEVLKQEGRFEVNSVAFLGRFDRVQKDGGTKCYHVISPAAENSNTICL